MLKKISLLAVLFILATPVSVKADAGISLTLRDMVWEYTHYPKVAEETVDAAEVDLLARVIYCESNTLEEEAQIYTGSVVLNRVNSDKFPNTLEEVIYQKGQYACTGKLYSITPTERQYEIAEDLLKSGSRIPETVVFQSEFRQGSGVWKIIENTFYCYL